jgi:hypothetical protein
MSEMAGNGRMFAPHKGIVKRHDQIDSSLRKNGTRCIAASVRGWIDV